ncbi:hypothetical protein AB685_10585 [Bacillus sp. LL01]|uniref:spore germination protein GerPC n=1 Tax=Bacillus sp. LL01 TaxID=1665556 RepID=UPI00064CEADE|nr:spore germination protein GerPC [Bacillus sp. LL01]KMJ58339.1 hypothetical protein AB685_10585 [Bacillus sp. LL01]
MTKHEEMEKRIVELERKLEYLVTILTEMHQKEDKVVQYHIKHLEIQSAQIEKLDYHLDSIGIEQLSGTLNIGNNFNKEKDIETKVPFYNKKDASGSENKTKSKNVPTYHNPITKKSRQFEEPKQHLKVTERERGFSIALSQKEEK